MKYHIKLRNKASLEQLLMRRRSTLQTFVNHNNIKTFEELTNMCITLNVIPPKLENCFNLFEKPECDGTGASSQEEQEEQQKKQKRKKQVVFEEKVQKASKNNDRSLPQTITSGSAE